MVQVAGHGRLAVRGARIRGHILVGALPGVLVGALPPAPQKRPGLGRVLQGTRHEQDSASRKPSE